MVMEIPPTVAELALAAHDAAELAWADLSTALETESPVLKARYFNRAVDAEAAAVFLKGA
jgi:hypothetical protein